MNREGKEIIVAIIGGIALIISALITGFFSSAPTRISIQATQTAEALNSPIISFTITPITITPTLQALPTLQPTPIYTPLTQPSPNSTIPFRKNELFLAISGVILIFGFIGVFIYLPLHYEDEGQPTISRIMISMALVSPFFLVWLSYFFSIPQNIPFALVLFVALLDLAIFLWFPEFFSEKINLFLSVLLLISPIYITAFGFTNMEIYEAFITASIISGIEILYVTVIAALANALRKKMV